MSDSLCALHSGPFGSHVVNKAEQCVTIKLQYEMHLAPYEYWTAMNNPRWNITIL